MSDCKHAIRMNSQNIKAYYRAAKACLILGKLKDCRQFCEFGLRVRVVRSSVR